MLVTKDVIYWYDGSYEGFLCCVFESFLNHEVPADVWLLTRPEMTMFPQVQVETDLTRAGRVEERINKLGERIRRIVMRGFLNDTDGKEVKLIRFLERCFSDGAKALEALADPVVANALELEMSVSREACRYQEILRFEDRGGMLGAVIRPQHYILPLLRGHFCDRMPVENFIIFDNNHLIAMVKKGSEVSYMGFDQPVILRTTESRESNYQTMWKSFFKAVTIEERRNEKVQRTHCPKKYWEYMVEMQG